MNILIILKNEKTEAEIEHKYFNLLEHAKHWAAGDNEVYIFGIKPPDKWKDAGFKFVKAPGRVPPNVRAFFWFLSGNHPRVDVIIETVDRFNFLFKKTATVLYLPSDWGKSLSINPLHKVKRSFKLSSIKRKFKNSYFLLSNFFQTKLLQDKIEAERMFLLKQGFSRDIEKIIPRENILGRSFLFASKSKSFEDYNSAIEVFKNIDRKQEGWRFTVLVDKNELHKVKKALDKIEFQNKVNVWAYESRKTLLKELSRADFYLDFVKNSESVFNCIQAMKLKTVVLTTESELFEAFPDFEKHSVISNEVELQKFSENALLLSNNDKKRKKHIDEAYSYAQGYTWKKLAKDSLSYLEKIRPE